MSSLFDLEPIIPGVSESSDVDTETTESEAPVTINEVAETIQKAADEAEENSAELHKMLMFDRRVRYALERWERLEVAYQHVATFGVDRTFLSLYNHQNILGRALQVDFPGCENFSAVGNPDSALSVAAMEGIGSGLQKIWEWILGIFRKIKEFIASIWNKIFGNEEKKAEEVQEKVEEVQKVVQTMDESDLNSRLSASSNYIVANNVIATFISQMEQYITRTDKLATQITKHMGISKPVPMDFDAENYDNKEFAELRQQVQNTVQKFKTLKEDKSMPLSKVSASGIKSLLNQYGDSSAKLNQLLMKCRQKIEIAKKGAEDAANEAALAADADKKFQENPNDSKWKQWGAKIGNTMHTAGRKITGGQVSFGQTLRERARKLAAEVSAITTTLTVISDGARWMRDHINRCLRLLENTIRSRSNAKLEKAKKKIQTV